MILINSCNHKQEFIGDDAKKSCKVEICVFYYF